MYWLCILEHNTFSIRQHNIDNQCVVKKHMMHNQSMKVGLLIMHLMTQYVSYTQSVYPSWQYLFIYLSVYLSIYLSIYSPIVWSIYLSTYSSIYLYLRKYLSILSFNVTISYITKKFSMQDKSTILFIYLFNRLRRNTNCYHNDQFQSVREQGVERKR